jgi:hypothetical protein
MRIHFKFLPEISHMDFVTEKIDEPPPTQQTLVATPPLDAAPNSAEMIEMLRVNSALARQSHPSQTFPQSTPPSGPSSCEGVLDETSFQDMLPTDSSPLCKPDYQRGNAMCVENPMAPLPAISPAAIERLKRSMAAFTIDDEGMESPVNSTNEKKAGPTSATPQTATIQQKPDKKTFSVVIQGGSTKEYYRSQLTIPSLLKIGKDLADACAYPDLNAHLFKYSNNMAYASITFQKWIDHAKIAYDELCRIYKVPPEKRVDLASLNYAVHCEPLTTPSTSVEIEHWERIRTERFNIFFNKASINGLPADPALKSIYRPTIEERLALLKGHPNLYEYAACTDCIIFAYKRVL